MFYATLNPVFPARLLSAGFVTIIIGLMLRSDKLGVTSVIRDLALSPGCYDSMLHFFRASSWSLEAVQGRAPYARGEKAVPGIRKLAKPEYIHGHMFGGLGILAGSVRN